MVKQPEFKLQPNEEIILALQPDARVGIDWLLSRWRYWAMVFVFFYLLSMIGVLGGQVPPLGISISALILIAAAALLWVNFIRQWHWYVITNQRCIIYAGFISVQKRWIPKNKIVDFDLYQTLVERVLGIASVRLNVPSLNQGGQAQMIGLPKKIAEQVMETLSHTHTGSS